MLPQEVGALADALLGPLLHLAPGIQGIAIRHELPAPADMWPRVQAFDLRLRHELKQSGKLQRFALRINSLRRAVLILYGDREDVQDRLPGIQHVDQALFHAACPPVALVGADQALERRPHRHDHYRTPVDEELRPAQPHPGHNVEQGRPTARQQVALSVRKRSENALKELGRVVAIRTAPEARSSPRTKAIHSQRLYRPETGKPDAYPNLQPVLSRPIELVSKRLADLGPVIQGIIDEGRTSHHQIAAALNERLVPASRGGAWSAVQVSRVRSRMQQPEY